MAISQQISSQKVFSLMAGGSISANCLRRSSAATSTGFGSISGSGPSSYGRPSANLRKDASYSFKSLFTKVIGMSILWVRITTPRLVSTTRRSVYAMSVNAMKAPSFVNSRFSSFENAPTPGRNGSPDSQSICRISLGISDSNSSAISYRLLLTCIKVLSNHSFKFSVRLRSNRTWVPWYRVGDSALPQFQVSRQERPARIGAGLSLRKQFHNICIHFFRSARKNRFRMLIFPQRMNNFDDIFSIFDTPNSHAGCSIIFPLTHTIESYGTWVPYSLCTSALVPVVVM